MVDDTTLVGEDRRARRLGSRGPSTGGPPWPSSWATRARLRQAVFTTCDLGRLVVWNFAILYFTTEIMGEANGYF